MGKRGLSDWAIWGLATIASLLVFGIGYVVISIAASKKVSHHERDVESKVIHGDKENPGEVQKNQGHQEGGKVEALDEKSRHSSEQSGQKSHEHWGYSGSGGPDSWGELDPGFKNCSAGKKQSPIDIGEVEKSQELLPIRFIYKPIATLVKNSGHAIQADIPKHTLYVEIEGERYDLMQYHFHSPSEHRISGQLYDAELHLVHRSAEGGLAVIGVLFEEGKNHLALEGLLKAIPEEVGELSQSVEINPMLLLPGMKTFFAYEGSLTTPPCTEGVKWHIMTEPAELSAKQLDTLNFYFKNNSRPVQNLVGRRVKRSTR